MVSTGFTFRPLFRHGDRVETYPIQTIFILENINDDEDNRRRACTDIFHCRICSRTGTL